MKTFVDDLVEVLAGARSDWGDRAEVVEAFVGKVTQGQAGALMVCVGKGLTVSESIEFLEHRDFCGRCGDVHLGPCFPEPDLKLDSVVPV